MLDAKQDTESTPTADQLQLFYLDCFLYNAPNHHPTSILPIKDDEMQLELHHHMGDNRLLNIK
jgi:hypothetical protein